MLDLALLGFRRVDQELLEETVRYLLLALVEVGAFGVTYVVGVLASTFEDPEHFHGRHDLVLAYPFECINQHYTCLLAQVSVSARLCEFEVSRVKFTNKHFTQESKLLTAC